MQALQVLGIPQPSHGTSQDSVEQKRPIALAILVYLWEASKYRGNIGTKAFVVGMSKFIYFSCGCSCPLFKRAVNNLETDGLWLTSIPSIIVFHA
jgi:hypothetical protein